MVGYTLEQIEGIAAQLRDLPAVENKKREVSKQEAVKLLSKEIAALQKRGYTLEQISEALRGKGLDIATPTLKSYLQRARPVRARSSGAAAAVSDTAAPVAEQRVRADGKKSDTAKASFATKPDSDDI